MWFKAIEENSNECTKIDKVFDKESEKENKKWEIIEKILGEYRTKFFNTCIPI